MTVGIKSSNKNSLSSSTKTSGSYGRFRYPASPYLDNASNIYNMKVRCDNTDLLHADLYKIIQVMCPFMLSTDDSNSSEDSAEHTVLPSRASLIKAAPLHIRPLLGGLSNELFLVSGNHTTVLVRIHPDTPPDITEVVDRVQENRLVAWLSQQGLAPTFFGRFTNGRVEEFYPNVVPLSFDTLYQYVDQIAPKMACFHRLAAPQHLMPKPATDCSLYHSMDRWQASISASTQQTHAALMERCAKEWVWLRAQLDQDLSQVNENGANQEWSQEAMGFIRQVVLTHMDAQSLNWLRDRATGKLYLIDFEYAGWNPRAVDIANTFLEYTDCTNLNADYPKDYPSPSQQDEYLTHYLDASDIALEATPLVLKTLRHEIGRYSLLAHLGWSIWSLVKISEVSQIEYDYIAFAEHRMVGYEWAKEQFF